MRFSRPSRPLPLLLLLAAAADRCSAKPYPRDDLHDVGYSYLMPRDCSNYCGADNQLCCSGDTVCTTLANNVATCVGSGNYVAADYTTTWTETHTYTSTIMTVWEAAPQPTAGVDCVPKNSEQEACGSICCAGWQTCAFQGQCSAKPGLGGGSTIVVTQDGKLTTQYSAPYRVTGTTTITTTGVPSNSASATETETTTAESATATSDNDTIGAGGGGGTGGHLSGGAIAGIVIGTLAGICLLLLLCFCCIARGLWGLIFGKKDKNDEKRERVDVYEERYSRHGSRAPSGHSRRDRHKGWFGAGGGGGGPSSAGERREKKKSNGGMWLTIAGLATTLLALLNMRKDKKPTSKPSRSSRYSDSYYSYSDYTSPSKPSSTAPTRPPDNLTRSAGSSSSGGRTAHTRRTRDSRARSYASRSRSERRP
ncbi:hypothetical protein G7046_g4465 [Stylonectria norvegica]|nr:hypothetical protein G7046_g4465 [Stylonectria norvegica]